MIAELNRLMGPMRRRVQNMVARAVISYVNDAAQAQQLQIQVLADEAHDDVERFQDYGFTSVPHPGAEAAVVFVGGTRSHGIVVAIEDRRYRLKGLQGGEVALYDDLGQAVHLKRDRVSLYSPMRVDIEAPKAVVISRDLSLGAEGGAAVARVGDSVAGGKIVSGSATVTSV